MKLAQSTWPQVEGYLKTNNVIIVPIGSTEQHGPSGFTGTDYLAARTIAYEVGNRTVTMVAPPLCFGMSLHHMNFPGTISLQPLTLVAVITDLIESLSQQGFKKIFFINGHGGNTASLQVAFQQCKSKDDKIVLQMIDWWRMDVVREYEQKHFGEASGSHATVGELSLIQFIFKNVQPADSSTIFTPKFAHHWPLHADEFRRLFPNGCMYSDPKLSSAEHGKAIFELAVNAICSLLAALRQQ